MCHSPPIYSEIHIIANNSVPEILFFMDVTDVCRLKAVKLPHIKIYENIISFFKQIQSLLRCD